MSAAEYARASAEYARASAEAIRALNHETHGGAGYA
jgi:hypothetical protein